jgi:hypothetical protein
MYKKLLNPNGGLLIPTASVLCDHIQKLEAQSGRLPMPLCTKSFVVIAILFKKVLSIEVK